MGAMRNRSQRLCEATLARALSVKTAANAQIAEYTGHDLPTFPKSPPRAITTYKATKNNNAENALASRNLGGSTGFVPPKAALPKGRPKASKI
jgi:hypothetical protein